VIDELVWHLQEGRVPMRVRCELHPQRGIHFTFSDSTAFFPIKSSLLQEHWEAAVAIIEGFPELAAMACIGPEGGR
jgi:hypothetical protein